MAVTECRMRLTPASTCNPLLSVAAVDSVPLVHFMTNVVLAVTLATPEGSMLPKFSVPGGVVTLQVPITLDAMPSGPEVVIAQLSRIIPVMRARLLKLMSGPNAAVKAATAIRVAVSHYIVRSDDGDQFLAQLRHAAGIKQVAD